MDPTSSSALGYGRAPRGKGSTRALKWMVALVVLSAGFFLVIIVGHYVKRRLQIRHFLAAQEVALNFTLPETQIVYCDDPSRSVSLLFQPSFIRMPKGPKSGLSQSTAFLRVAPEVVDLNQSANSIFKHPVFLGTQNGTLFLHDRRSPSGHDRLVCVSIGPDADLHVLTITPCTSTKFSYFVDCLGGFDLNRVLDRPMTFYAGHADPNDLSHFTIPFDIEGAPHMIDAYLRDNDFVLIDPHFGYQFTLNPSLPYGVINIDMYAADIVQVVKPLVSLGMLRKHTNSRPSPIAFSSDSKLLVFYDAEKNQIRQIDTTTGDDARPFLNPAYYPIAMEYSSDGRELACLAGGDLIVDAITGKPVPNQPPDSTLQATYDIFRDPVLDPSLPASITMPDGRTFPTSQVMSAMHVISADHRYIACHMMGIWGVGVLDVSANRFAFVRGYGDMGQFDRPLFSPDDKFLAANERETGLCLWTMPDGKKLFKFDCQGPIGEFAFSPDGTRLATVDIYDATLCIWDVKALQQ